MLHVYADAILVLHVLVAAFIVGGMVLIFIGGYRRWRWVYHWWFRAIHLGLVFIVALESWVGLLCPLTTLEMALRAKAGQAHYEGSFVQYWLERLLYYDAPPWVFISAYSVFAAIAVGAWFYYRPRQ